MRHAVPGEPERLAARRLGRDLHGHLPLQRGHRDLAAQRGYRQGHRQVGVEIVALPLETRVRRDRHAQVEVAAGRAVARAAPDALRRHAHARPGVHARRDLHLQVARALGPAAASAPRAGAPVDVARAAALRARLVELERDRLLGALERLLERELDGRLHVAAAAHRAEAAAAQVAQIRELVLGRAGPGLAATEAAQVREDRAEEIREASRVAFLAEPDAARPAFERRAPGARPGLGVSLPVGPERIVALALVGVSEDRVGLVDLLEAV